MASVKAVKCVVLLLVGWTCGLEAQLLPTNSWRTTNFSYSAGSLRGGIKIEWDGKVLRYRRDGWMGASPNTNRIVTPTPAQWKAFWAVVDDVQLWKWQPRYTNPNISDGGYWKFEAERGANRVSTYGRNSYPADADPAKPSEDSFPTQRFRKFYSALEKLLGFDLWPE